MIPNNNMAFYGRGGIGSRHRSLALLRAIAKLEYTSLPATKGTGALPLFLGRSPVGKWVGNQSAGEREARGRGRGIQEEASIWLSCNPAS